MTTSVADRAGHARQAGAADWADRAVHLTPGEKARLVYSGEHLKEIAFPLGGIGTGTISLGGRGNLQDFEIANRPAKGQPPLRNFFAIAVDDGSGTPNARILERQLFPPFTGYRGIAPHLVPGLPRFPEATFTGEYPLAKVALSDPGFPVRATLEAFNPMIPGNVADSGLPVAYFLWTLENSSQKRITGQLVATLANLIGYPITPWEGDPAWEGGAPQNTALRDAGFHGVRLGSERDGGRHPFAGSMALGTTWEDTAMLPQWERQDWIMSLRPFWYQVLGELPFDESVRPGLDRAGQYHRAQAALAARFTLEPGEQVTVPVIVSWHFPNRVLPLAERQGMADGWVGNEYATRFEDTGGGAALCGSGARATQVADTHLPPAPVRQHTAGCGGGRGGRKLTSDALADVLHHGERAVLRL